MKRTALAIVLALAFSTPGLWAQQVTKVGICDFSRVLNTSYRESKTVREFYEAQQTIKKEQAAIEKEIADLQNQRLEADKAGNADLVLQLDRRLSDKRRYLDDYKKIKGDWVRQQAERILGSSNFLRDILDVVKVVAESEGMALVVRSDATGADLILYNIPEIDITEKVIKEIFRRAGKPYTGGSD
jgi:Skp family chaperone for outer membrane proteins